MIPRLGILIWSVRVRFRADVGKMDKKVLKIVSQKCNGTGGRSRDDVICRPSRVVKPQKCVSSTGVKCQARIRVGASVIKTVSANLLYGNREL